MKNVLLVGALTLASISLAACTADQINAGVSIGAAAAAPACAAYAKTAAQNAACLSVSGATLTVAQAIANGEIN